MKQVHLARHKDLGLVEMLSESATEDSSEPEGPQKYRIVVRIPNRVGFLNHTMKNAEHSDFTFTDYEHVKDEFDRANKLTGQYDGFMGKIRDLVFRYLF